MNKKTFKELVKIEWADWDEIKRKENLWEEIKKMERRKKCRNEK